MEPPCEHGGVSICPAFAPKHRRASMEPPCEHGGVHVTRAVSLNRSRASMEPPCEHGGVVVSCPLKNRRLSSFNGAAV